MIQVAAGLAIVGMLFFVSAEVFAGDTAEAPVLEKGATGVQLRECGAHLREDFNSADLNTTVWRWWHSDADKTRMGIEDGHFAIEAKDQIGHNGLWQLNGAKYKDVTLVARMDAHSDGDDPHQLLLHLCGGEMPKSPDHWVEIGLMDRGDSADFIVMAALPKGTYTQGDKRINVPRGGEDGYLARLDLNGVTNLVYPSVKSGDTWLPVADPIELLLRTTHCEIKMRRSGPPQGGPTTTQGWFDDVRIYPRAASHPILVRLVTPDGAHVWSRGESKNEWPPVINVKGKGERSIEDLVVELRTANGKLVSSVQSSNMGHYMLKVDHPDWDVFPVAAEIRILLDGELFGEPIKIDQDGLNGLYPDDVWDLVME